MRQESFYLRNDGTDAVAMTQGYTSCGCTTIAYPKDSLLAPGDSARVTLRFNPQGKGGEFYERGVVVYGTGRQSVELVMEGECITSEETLLRQFPIRIADSLRINTGRFDLGTMVQGTARKLHVAILHRDEADRQETLPITFVADESYGTGLQHIALPLETQAKHGLATFSVTIDVVIKPAPKL